MKTPPMAAQIDDDTRQTPDGGAIPRLTGERLVLRAMTPDDAPDVQRMAGDRRVAQTTSLIPHPYPDGAAEQWIATHAEQFHAGAGVTWAIALRETDELVGAIGLIINAEHGRAELGYWIGAAYWNRGYVTEAGRLALHWAFVERDLNRVHAHHFQTNPASGSVMRKLGMTYEGTARKHFRKWGTLLDCVYYAILREEYEAMMRR